MSKKSNVATIATGSNFNPVIDIDKLPGTDQRKAFQLEYDWIESQPGVTIVEVRWCAITANGIGSEVVIEGWKDQSRTVTIKQTHKNNFVAYFKEFNWNVFPPIPVIYDPITGKWRTKGGHHRLTGAMEAGLDFAPVFVLEFDDAGFEDGLTAEKEFKQADNGRHKEALRHDEDDALKYLQELQDDGYFTKAEQLLDIDERKKEVRRLAHKQLAKHYSSYSKQKRAGAITTYLNGTLPCLIKTWTSKDADAWFTGNGHLSSLGVYDYKNNRLDLTTQAHTLVTYPVGQILEIMRDVFDELRADGVSEACLRARAATFKVRMGVYDNRPKSWQQLTQNRATAIARATRMANDSMFGLSFVYDEIKFIYQSIAAPNMEPECPIVHKRDAQTKTYVLQP